MTLRAFSHASDVLRRAHEDGVFSAVVAEVGTSTSPAWTYAHGRLTWDAGASLVTTDTVFDLASLTKVLATATVALQVVARRQMTLDEPVDHLLATWAQAGRHNITIRDLLDHSSGLPAHRRYFETQRGRHEFDLAIAREPADYPPRTRAIYSDLGFMALGFAIEERTASGLATCFEQWRDDAGVVGALCFLPPASWWPHTAATERDPWRGRLLQGEVHDENAAALDGVAGHAGLFGTAAAVGAVARWWLQRLRGADDPLTGISPAHARQFATRSTVPGSSRALGWDTMLQTSSCGTHLSPYALGHTGFTGTSLWIDPETDRYMVLLTNRVHPTRVNDRIQDVRRAFHDAVALDWTD